ncbi:glucosyltransferase domain-containing protein [Hyphococcus sp. DH-69]|uniref:glucosyltransferase domain-containing protein n=1 Tax=Hyphococcus formosus TaxID=3143534 RepID=UPI00398BB3C6
MLNNRFFNDPVRQIAAAWTFGLSFLAYFIFIAQHLIGNHALRMPWLHPREQIGNGRWLGPIIGHLHYDADVPVFMPLISIIIGIAAVWLASRLWRTQNSISVNVIVFSFVMLFPTNLALFYYTFMTPIFFIPWVFAALAVLIVDRFSIWRIVVGAVCVLLMMASYQSALSVLGVLILTRLIITLMETPTDQSSALFKKEAQIIAAQGIAVILGGIAYIISLDITGAPTSQSLEFSSLQAFIDHVKTISVEAFRHLWITQPDILRPLKYALLGLLIAAILLSVWRARKTPVRALIILLLWPFVILATKAVFFVADPAGNLYEYRYNPGLGFLHAFSACIILKSLFRPGLGKMTAYVVFGVFLTTMMQADLVRQHVLQRGQTHDLAIANRVLMRIETLDEFDATKTYDLIRVGHYSRFRANLFRKEGRKIDRGGDGHMDYGEITDRWIDEDVFRLLGARIKFKHKTTDPQFSKKIKEVRESGILNERKPWPHESSVFIHNDRIIVYMQ